jgi:predicted negative regulator of RcsB-dependent stress response
LASPKSKTLKQPGPIRQADPTFSQKAHEWLEANRNLVGAATAGLFVLFLIVLGVQSYLRSQESRAGERYAQVIRQWPQDLSGADEQTLSRLIADLEQLVREHDGRTAAWLARMDLARVLYQVRRYEDALGQSQRVLDGASDKILRSMARYQTAVTLQAMGRSEEAIAHWTAMKSEGAIASEREIHWKLGALHGVRKEYPRAIEHLEAALKAGGDYPSSQLLEDQLAVFKTAASRGS